MVNLVLAINAFLKHHLDDKECGENKFINLE